jgi:hypothetical protein
MRDSDSAVQPGVSGYYRKRQKNVDQWKKVQTRLKRTMILHTSAGRQANLLV